MAVFIALLRAVNVGGSGKLPMKDLRAMCADIGFESVQTYIASGNVIFESRLGASNVQKKLESALLAYAGRPIGVLVRTQQEMASVLDSNPFPDAAPNHTIAVFLNRAVCNEDIGAATGVKNEELGLGTREIYVHYRDGIATSKMKLPAAEVGTGRNMNTVAKLATIASST